MEPGQQEVEAGTLVGFFAHPRSRDCAEGTDESSFNSRRRFKGEDMRGTKQVNRNLKQVEGERETMHDSVSFTKG